MKIRWRNSERRERRGLTYGYNRCRERARPGIEQQSGALVNDVGPHTITRKEANLSLAMFSLLFEIAHQATSIDYFLNVFRK